MCEEECSFDEKSKCIPNITINIVVIVLGSKNITAKSQLKKG